VIIAITIVTDVSSELAAEVNTHRVSLPC
jgi:hypothetical protein